jgi:cell division septum initiation protein DivIVA
MADFPEVVRKQMEDTRSDLEDKLEALESQVSETVQATSEAVSETVESVKETVENVTSTVKETVQTVAQTFDLSLQTERHPWIVFGASVAAGCMASRLVGGHRRMSSNGGSWSRPASRSSETSWATRDWEQSSQSSEQTSSAREELARNGRKGWFSEELGRLKGLALGTVMSVVRELAARGFPGELGQRLAQEVDHLNTKLGGENIQGSLLFADKDK